MEFKLLEEVWSSKKVKFSHLIVFFFFFFVFLMFILILMPIVNLMQSLKYVFLLVTVMRNLAIGFGMKKTRKSDI